MSAFRPRWVPALWALLAVSACKSSPAVDTAIVVEVSSDLQVPTEIDRVRVSAADLQGRGLYERWFSLAGDANRLALPFRVGLYPNHDTQASLHIEVAGHLQDDVVVSRSATLPFIHGREVVLPMALMGACRSVPCAVPYQTCKGNGICEPDTVSTSELPPYVANQPLARQDAASGGPDVEPARDDAPARDGLAPDLRADADPDVAGGDAQADLPTTADASHTVDAGSTVDAANTADGASTVDAGKTAGTRCAAGEACGPGLTCLDGVCCTQTSCPQCRNCGSDGTCTLVVANADDTTGDGCLGANACNATGTCQKKDGQTCSTDGECASASCNGDHRCGPRAPSRCPDLAMTCGPQGNGDCCFSLLVPGGTFYRGYDAVDFLDKSHPATVADFYMDKYEITVGRFRRFVNAGQGTQASPPRAGAGAHPSIPGSGWSSTWNASLPATTAALQADVSCQSVHRTWTDAPGANESMPINCLSWYEAFAFCIWDGGRLATETEWQYAASGGSEQRYYPWSVPPAATSIDDSYAVYCAGACYGRDAVGTKSPKGDGRWGQSDLAGNLFEWTLDWYAPYLSPCIDCANLATSTSRVTRGGNFLSNASYLRSASRSDSNAATPDGIGVGIGARCVRQPPSP